MDLYLEGGSAGPKCNSQTIDKCDPEETYLSVKEDCGQAEVIYQNINVVGKCDSLFYTPVKIGESITLSAMLDSGSMAWTINESAEMKLRSAAAVDESGEFNTDVVLVGCGGLRVKPKSSFNLTMEVYGIKMLVPTLVIPGQHDELILGTNVIKHILRYLKMSNGFWQAVSNPTSVDPECEIFGSISRARS